MKLLKFKFLFILCAACFSITSCGDDDIDCDNNTEVNAALDRVINASNAFVADPTNTDLCNEFVDANEDFLQLARDFEECVPASDLEAFRNNIQVAEDNLAMLDC